MKVTKLPKWKKKIISFYLSVQRKVFQIVHQKIWICLKKKWLELQARIRSIALQYEEYKSDDCILDYYLIN